MVCEIGAITLTKGNLVTPSTPALASVNQLDPIRVVFSISDRVVVGALQKSGATQDKLAAGLTLDLLLPDGSKYPQAGKIAFLSNQIDTATGTLSIYGDFGNPQRLLLPGAYVTVKVRTTKPQERPLVPAEALQTDQSGSFVLVVGADNKVKQQSVTLGRQMEQAYIVQTGLSGGERVIIAGVQKAKPGETVNPQLAPPPPQAAAQNSPSSGPNGTREGG